jgi:hypothetical protein
MTQSLLLAAAGERTPVIIDAVALIVLLAFAECRPSGRQLQLAAGLTAAAMPAITGVRAVQGRSMYNQDTGLGTRATALADGLSAVRDTMPQGGSGLVAQAAIRLDGVDFAGAILHPNGWASRG